MSSYNSSIGEWEEDAEEEVEEDVALDVYSTCCKRECVETFHDTGKETAMDEVAKLYELVKNMPEGPQKAHFMKRVSASSLRSASSCCFYQPITSYLPCTYYLGQ